MVLETLPVGVVIADARGRIVLDNAATRELWGVPPETPSWQDYSDWVAWWPDTGKRIRAHEWAMSRALLHGEETRNELVQNRRFGSGELRFYPNNVAPLRDEQGTVIGGVAAMLDVTEQRKAEEALRRSEEALRELNETLEKRVAERTAEVHQQAIQLERKRLAKILHDHIQQLIVAAQMQTEWMKLEHDPDRIRATAKGVYAILQEALQASRSLAVELSPPVLRETGLIGGLNWLAVRIQEQHQFSVSLRASNRAEPPDEETRFFLFECVRELLLNVVKHAGVRKADVILMRPKDGGVRVIVRDRGRGFDPDVVRKRRPDEVSFELFSIQERLAHLGGRMEIESAPGRGTRVTLSVPIAGGEETAREAVEVAPAGESAGTISVRRKPDVIRVLIVDDHRIMRQGLSGLVGFESDIEVVGGQATGRKPSSSRKAWSPTSSSWTSISAGWTASRPRAESSPATPASG